MKYKVKLRVTGTTTLTVNVNDYDEAKGAALAKFDDGDDGELELDQEGVLSVKEVAFQHQCWSRMCVQVETLKYLLLLLLLAGCPDASAPATTQPVAAHATQAIKDWKTHGLYWPRIENCSPYIVELVPVPQDDLQALCGLDAQLYACLDGNTIYIDEDIMNTVRTDYVVEHELRHWLGGCAYGDVDGNHTRTAYWFTYRGQDIRQ